MFSRFDYSMELVAILYDQTERNLKWKIQDGVLSTSSTCISTCTQDSNEIPSAIPMFSGSNCAMELVVILYDQTGRNRQWKIV